ncbi:MAG: ABC transporter ATP-binding protein [Armatimonadetes bacterium]|nr:ABC transporter ATP-binding protein [Armatimonadota bacterium]
MIVFQEASRWYGQIIGLNDVTCTIPTGVTALLGLNGAGKSTMLRMITGQIRATTGTVSVYGQTPFANPEVYKLIGYCPEIDNFYEHMNGFQFVEHLGRLAGYGKTEARERSRRMIERVGMADRAHKKIAGYSKGMRQRVKLAQAMIHDPQAVLLDEPLNGLDPVGRREFMQLLQTFSEDGKTILVSSHILFEVEQMTSNIVLLHRGRLLATGNIGVIRELIDKYPHRIRIATTQAREVATQLAGLPYISNISFERDGLEIQTREPDKFYDYLPSLAVQHGLPIDGFSSPDNNLESVFRYLVTN